MYGDRIRYRPRRRQERERESDERYDDYERDFDRRDSDSFSMGLFQEPFEEKVERFERKCRYLIWGS